MLRFKCARGFTAVVGQIGNGRKAFFAVVGLGLQGHVTARHAGLHFDYFFGLDIELVRHLGHLGWRERIAMGIAIQSVAFHALFHRTQIEEELALRFGRGHFDHAPILQDVLMDLGANPMQGVAH